MITLRLDAIDCNPAIVGDLVMLNHSIIMGLSRCDYQPASGSYMRHTLYVEYETPKNIGFVQVTVNDRNISVHLIAETMPAAFTLADALIDALSLSKTSIKIIDPDEH